MLRFKQYLIEAKGKLSFKDLSKFRSGAERGQIIHQWIKDKKPVKIDGSEKTLEYISTSHETAMKNSDYEYFKDGSKNLPIWSDGRNLIKITDLDKTSEFGGGGGSGAGSDVTDHTESAQCVYAQAMMNGSKNFTVDELTTAYKQVDVTSSLDKILDIADEWRESCITGAKILKNATKGKSYTYHRGSSWVNSLESHFKTLNKKAGNPFKNINKWSPADIWLVGTQADTNYNLTNTESLIELNSVLHDAFKAKQIMGVSLKLMKGTTHVDSVNYRPDKVVPHYTGRTVGKKGFYNAKDVYINFEDGEIQFRTFPDSWQGEIKGKNANMGKISHGSINSVLKMIGIKEQITNQVQLRTMIKKKRDTFMKSLYRLAKAEKIADVKSVDSMSKKLEGKDVNWLLSKYCGLELFNIMRSRSGKKEDKVTGGILSYASSQSDLSAPFLKLM
tara:strand:+ start:759 stop:2096 length:1338 start_codon:yes stop_codon:yes gene_type:complete